MYIHTHSVFRAMRLCCECQICDPFVTFVNCDHIVQQKVEISKIRRCLGYVHAEADPDHIML